MFINLVISKVNNSNVFMLNLKVLIMVECRMKELKLDSVIVMIIIFSNFFIFIVCVLILEKILIKKVINKLMIVFNIKEVKVCGILELFRKL